MRKVLLTIAAAAAVFSAASLMAPRAEAMTITLPSNIQAAIADDSLIQEAAYVCRRVWRCNPWGCGWRRVCWWRPGPPYRRYWRRRYWW
jgi:hypothetical protein